MPRYDFHASIGYWLTTTTQAYHRRLSERLTPHGITHRQLHVIGWLAYHGTLSQAELARLMMIEPPTLVRVLDRMEAAGWVARSGDARDRRRHVVQLTPAADPLWNQITAVARQLRGEATAGLSEAEIDQLRTLLERVQENLRPSTTDGARPSDAAGSAKRRAPPGASSKATRVRNA